MASALASSVAARMASAPFTYAEPGMTGGVVPAGFRTVRRSRRLRRRDFPGAAEDLLAWRVHERAGLAVAASAPRAHPGCLVRLRLGRGPIAIEAPCRVVFTVDEPERAGFAYGTLAGHPESGEELFLLFRGLDGGLTFTITAISTPATLLARVGGPFTGWVQAAMTARYLAAIDV
jgi:uncharacterized protein (UPF0548 family)